MNAKIVEAELNGAIDQLSNLSPGVSIFSSDRIDLSDLELFHLVDEVD